MKSKAVKMILENPFISDPRVYKEAQYLISLGYDVEILCWDKKLECLDKEIDIIDGIKIKRFYIESSPYPLHKRFSSYIKFAFACKEYLKDKSYGFLHCHNLEGIIAGYIACNKKAKLIFDMHEIYESRSIKAQKYRYIVRSFVSFFQSKADYIIYLNEKQKNVMCKRNQRKLIFLPNYPEYSKYQDIEKTKSNKIRISIIGRVIYSKQIINLFEACKGLEGVTIFVHGDGPSLKKIQEIAYLYDNVVVTGAFTYDEISSIYSETDISYIMYPMEAEQLRFAYPNRIFDSIVTQTPAIVSKYAHCAELIEKESIGYAVDGDKVEDIRNLIMKIVSNPTDVIEKGKNLEKLHDRFIWENVVTNLNKIYK